MVAPTGGLRIGGIIVEGYQGTITQLTGNRFVVAESCSSSGTGVHNSIDIAAAAPSAAATLAGFSTVFSSGSFPAFQAWFNFVDPTTSIGGSSFIGAGPGFIWKSYSGSGSLPHAVLICGYDDAKHAYKVMSSWGTSWGDGGFSWIDYDFFVQKSSYNTYVIQ
jgi:hypothetical protein